MRCLLSLAVILPAVLCGVIPDAEDSAEELQSVLSLLSPVNGTEDTLSTEVSGDLTVKSIVDLVKAHGEILFGKQKDSKQAEHDPFWDFHRRHHQHIFGPVEPEEPKIKDAVVHVRLTHAVRDHSVNRFVSAVTEVKKNKSNQESLEETKIRTEEQDIDKKQGTDKVNEGVQDVEKDKDTDSEAKENGDIEVVFDLKDHNDRHSSFPYFTESDEEWFAQAAKEVEQWRNSHSLSSF